MLCHSLCLKDCLTFFQIFMPTTKPYDPQFLWLAVPWGYSILLSNSANQQVLRETLPPELDPSKVWMGPRMRRSRFFSQFIQCSWDLPGVGWRRGKDTVVKRRRSNTSSPRSQLPLHEHVRSTRGGSSEDRWTWSVLSINAAPFGGDCVLSAHRKAFSFLNFPLYPLLSLHE